jgi:hypothetical protein
MPGAALNWGACATTKQVRISGHLYFRTYRTSCRCHSAPAWNCRTRCTSRPRRAGFGPSYASRFSVGENRCSGSAVFSAVAASRWPRRAVGPEEGDRGEVAKSAVQSNEMPVAPDRVCPIGSSPVFRTVRRSKSERFRAVRAGRNRAGPGQVSPIKASTSRTSATALVRSDAGRRILTGDGEGGSRACGSARSCIPSECRNQPTTTPCQKASCRCQVSQCLPKARSTRFKVP